MLDRSVAVEGRAVRAVPKQQLLLSYRPRAHTLPPRRVVSQPPPGAACVAPLAVIVTTTAWQVGVDRRVESPSPAQHDRHALPLRPAPPFVQDHLEDAVSRLFDVQCRLAD